MSSLLALLLCGLFYGGAIAWLLYRKPSEPPASFDPQPVHLSFAQVALQAEPEPPLPEPEPEPEPPPEPVPEIEPEADIALESVEEEPFPEPEPPEPEPIPEPLEKAVQAEVSQEAAAPAVEPVPRAELLAWVQRQIEQEKYYPPSARRAGYEGRFRLQVNLDPSGTVVHAAVLDGRGHPLLRHSLEKIMEKLNGRRFGRSLPEEVSLPFEFEFQLQ